MATISTTTTSEHDAALTILLRKLNAERAAMTPSQTPLTATQFVTYLLTQWLDGLVSQGKAQSEGSIRDAWQKANTATKDQVKTLLGVQ